MITRKHVGQFVTVVIFTVVIAAIIMLPVNTAAAAAGNKDKSKSSGNGTGSIFESWRLDLLSKLNGLTAHKPEGCKLVNSAFIDAEHSETLTFKCTSNK